MKIFSFISDLFLKVIRKLKPIFLAVFTTAFQILLEKLKDVATEYIIQAASGNMSNEEKRAETFKNMKAYALRTAITVTDRDINLIIEMVYAQLKNIGRIQ